MGGECGSEHRCSEAGDEDCRRQEPAARLRVETDTARHPEDHRRHRRWAPSHAIGELAAEQKACYRPRSAEKDQQSARRTRIPFEVVDEALQHEVEGG